jgi:hypothetical protein
LANGLPQRDLDRASGSVIEWVKLNREMLLRFWNDGDSYSIHQVVDLVKSLNKL